MVACEGMRQIEKLGRIETNYNSSDNTQIILNDMDSVLAMVQSNCGAAFLPVIEEVSVTGLKYIAIDRDEVVNGGPGLTLEWNRAADSPVLRNLISHAKDLFST